jgi:hypothetical protein
VYTGGQALGVFVVVMDLGYTGAAPMSFGRNCAAGSDVLGKRQQEE